MFILKNINALKNILNPSETKIELDNLDKNRKNKINSLAYISYKNRKEKGLISNEKEECPTIYFGDEWAF